MGSSTPPTPPNKKEWMGFGNVISRVKGALKKGEAGGSRRKSALNTSASAVASSSSFPIVSSTASNAGQLVEVTIRIPANSAYAKAAEARAKYEALREVSKLSKAQLFEDRAKRFSERFGLELHSSPWQGSAPDDTVLRMDKPIRMRVRRTCHECNATFASTKECAKCQHISCAQCTRHPAKRTEAELIASREKRAKMIKQHKETAPIAVDWNWESADVAINRPSRTGGQDLVYRKPRQRVRRTCHECHTMFAGGSKVCEKCQHVRCTDCPRDPSRKNKYPLGYPGDEFGPNSVPHYECQRCRTMYPTGAEDGTECQKCQHPKTDQSPRALPRRVRPPVDEDALAQVREKLDRLKVT